MIRLARLALALWVVLLWPATAWAQFGNGLGPDPTALPQQQPTQTGPSPGQGGPEQHAASGGDGPSVLPTEEAQLPEKPNKIPKQLDGLLESVRCDDAEGDRHTGGDGRVGDASRGRSGDVLKMGRLPANHATQADDGIVAVRLG